MQQSKKRGLTRVRTIPGLCVRSILAVTNTSRVCSIFTRSRDELMAQNVPVRPTPSLDRETEITKVRNWFILIVTKVGGTSHRWLKFSFKNPQNTVLHYVHTGTLTKKPCRKTLAYENELQPMRGRERRFLQVKKSFVQSQAAWTRMINVSVCI